MPNPFSGTIDLDVRNSKPDWGAFLDKKAPANAPNVLVILYDDTGCAAWSPYGGRINSEGVIFAQGSRFGGHSMFVKDGKLSYVYNFLGIPPEQRVTCPAPTSGKHRLRRWRYGQSRIRHEIFFLGR